MNFLLSLGITLIKNAVDSTLWDELLKLVTDAEKMESGTKRGWVLDQLNTDSKLQGIISEMAGWLVGLTLEAVVAHFNMKK